MNSYLQVFRRRWWIVAVVAAVCIGGAVALAERTPATYESQVQLFVSAQSPPTSASALSNAYQGGLFTQQQVQSFVDIANSASVTVPVIRSLRLHITPTTLARKISATAPANTVLIYLNVTDRSPAEAQRLAAATASAFISVINKLERPARGGRSQVQLSISDPATLPTGPVSPKKTLDVVLGVLLGVALGLGLALVRERWDTTIKVPQDLQTVGTAPVLGLISDDRRLASTLQSGALSGSQSGEALRHLRTNLRFVDVDRPPKRIVITSALPGEGKSTIACGLAIGSAAGGQTVALVEGDLRSPSLARYLNLQKGEGLTTALIDRRRVWDLMVPVGDTGRIGALLAGFPVPNPSELLSSEQMKHILDDLTRRFDLVIIDAPPLLPVTDAAVLATHSDGAIVAVRAGKTTRRDVQAAFDVLAKVNARILGTVLNATPQRVVGYYGYGYGRPLSGVEEGARGEERQAPGDRPAPVKADAGMT